jgi:serine/threonine protein kinase
LLQEQTTLPVGATIQHPGGGRYAIERLLGKGGFGAVYLVRDRHVKQRLFALKEVIDPGRRDRERFFFEAEVLKRLNHRALPHVYQVFEHEKLKRVYMLMDYIEGRDLEALLAEQPGHRFSLPLALALMAPIVDALIYLHGQHPPIVHRDIKPANIIVPSKGGEAVLVDFGIAKEYVIDNTTNIIRHGSPGYAAPEQYGSGTNPRTDIYGLGATLYTLLTSRVPIEAITRATASKGIDPLTPANLVAPDLPWAAAIAIEQAMSISSEDRFATVEEFWQVLTGPVTKQEVQPAPTPSFITPQPLTVPEQELEHMTIAPPSLQHLSSTPSLRKRLALLPILLAPLLIVAIGMGLLAVIKLRHEDTVSTTKRITPTLTSSTPTSTPASGSPVYPALTESYTGTVYDLMTNQKTSLFLTHVQRNGVSISGYFQGLGLVGPFKGTITTHGHLDFTVTLNGAGVSALSFHGDIKIGGDLTGYFDALNQQGHSTGESGIWYASSNS